ncbi:hypothetical protein CEP54_001154 [Fusarium duplospermum]|uniref:Uncharacterized protein n=1 Tax=Fusarium duplospermum TaxID=1325734 RepID=A0A428R387_9HYPO|nr:hypothetical protein CEP54_001154 [Fusarium duplospermum]
MLYLPTPIRSGSLEGIYTCCQRCGAGCTVPVGEKFRDHLGGERSIYCTNECWRQHGMERGIALYNSFANPIICEPPPAPDIILPLYLSRPHPKDIVWPALEMPEGGSGYGYPNVNWLHWIPDTKLHGYLIDSFRLRMQDIKGRPVTRLDIFYRDWNKDMAGFNHYLDLAEQTPGLLPIEWNSKRAACENLCKHDQYYNLANLDALNKSSIIMHHGGDRECILKLRELAQAVFGYAPGNCSLSKL